MKDSQLLLLMFSCLIATVISDDCVYEECDCSGVTISCINKGLPEFPPIVHTSKTGYENVYLDSNMITWIPDGSFPPNLKDISLASNPIEEVDDLAFNDSSTTLQTLTFSNVVFTRLPNALLYLKNLSNFNIYNSNLMDWNVGVMNSLGKTLQTISIQNCGLSVWPTWMQNLTHLTALSLPQNNLSSIPDDALDHVAHSLTSLSIVSNRLTTVPKALSKLMVLETLSLEQNKITDVSWLPSGSRLSSLSIHTNYIFDTTKLNVALLPYAGSLHELDLENNRLTAIPNLALFTMLAALSFSNNRISDSNSGSLSPLMYTLDLDNNSLRLIPRVLSTLRSVTDMVLSSNSIQQIRAVDFPAWVVGAELDNNLITELTDTSFPVNASVQFLHLSSNPISAISSGAFKNTPNLYQLSLRYTKLTRLPLAFASANSLHSFDFTGSSQLVCTCTEKSLTEWITTLSQYDIVGDCGIISIYDFFVTLAPQCPD